MIFLHLTLLRLRDIAQECFVSLGSLIPLLQLFLVRSVGESTEDLHLFCTIVFGQQACVEPVFYLSIQVVLIFELFGAILVVVPCCCGALAIVGHVEL